MKQYISAALKIVDKIKEGPVTIIREEGKVRRRDRLTGKSVWKEISTVSGTHDDYPGVEWFPGHDGGQWYASFSLGDENYDVNSPEFQEADVAVDEAMMKYLGH